MCTSFASFPRCKLVNVQTTHNTSTITDSVVYIYICTISYHTLNIVYHIVHISDTYLHNSYDKNGGFTKATTIPHKQKKNTCHLQRRESSFKDLCCGSTCGVFPKGCSLKLMYLAPKRPGVMEVLNSSTCG